MRETAVPSTFHRGGGTGVTIVSLFRQEERIGSLLGLPFYMSGGSKHQQAEVARLTLPLLLLGTFKLWLSVTLLTAVVTELELLTGIEINTGNRNKGQSKKSYLAGRCM